MSSLSHQQYGSCVLLIRMYPVQWQDKQKWYNQYLHRCPIRLQFLSPWLLIFKLQKVPKRSWHVLWFGKRMYVWELEVLSGIIDYHLRKMGVHNYTLRLVQESSLLTSTPGCPACCLSMETRRVIYSSFSRTVDGIYHIYILKCPTLLAILPNAVLFIHSSALMHVTAEQLHFCGVHHLTFNTKESGAGCSMWVNNMHFTLVLPYCCMKGLQMWCTMNYI